MMGSLRTPSTIGSNGPLIGQPSTLARWDHYSMSVRWQDHRVYHHLRYTKYDLLVLATSICTVAVLVVAIYYMSFSWYWLAIGLPAPILFVLTSLWARGASLVIEIDTGRIAFRWRTSALWVSVGQAMLDSSRLVIRPIDLTSRTLFVGRKPAWAVVWETPKLEMAIAVAADVHQLWSYVEQLPAAIQGRCELVEKALVV